MSIATLLETIRGKQHKRQTVRLADFRGIVVQIADGKEPDPDFVAAALREAEKTVDELRTAVELLERRRDLQKKCNGVSHLLARRQELERQMAQADREVEAAESKHYATVNSLSAELQQVREATDEGEKARRELWDTCSDQILLDKLADVQLRLSQRRAEADDLRRRVSNLRSWAESERTEAQRRKMIVDGDGETQVEVHLARAREHGRNAAEREALLARTNKIVADLEREEAAIREQMLAP
jgi:hypothetical protein